MGGRKACKEAVEVLLLAIPARLQTGMHTAREKALGWAWFESLVRGYIDSLYESSRRRR